MSESDNLWPQYWHTKSPHLTELGQFGHGPVGGRALLAVMDSDIFIS